MSNTLGAIRGQMILDVKQALKSYTAVRQEHVSTVTALSTGGGAIAASGAMIAAAGLGIAAGFVSAINAAAEFERKLDFFGAVSDASVEDMEAIREKALQLGADTIYSADQIADSFTDLAKAGVGVDELLAGIGEAVANLGAATDMPLAEAATSLTTILNTFGLEAEDAVNVVDKLAGAANSSSIDVQDLITTMTYAGASAKTAGVEFEDVNTAIALLGERGIKGSKAGTGLRQMFDKLIAPTNKGRKALEGLGIILEDGTNQLLDFDGGLKPIPELLETLNSSLEGLSTSEKMDILGQIFPITSLPTILNLLDGGAEGMARLNAEIGKTTALDIASKRLDNLSGDLEILRGNIDTLMIESGSGFQTFARSIVQGITAMLQWFMDLDPAIQQIILVSLAVVSAFLILIGTLGVMAGAILNLIGLWLRVAPAMTALIGIITKLAGAIKLLWLAFIPKGLGPLIVILGVIAAALTYFFTQTEQGQAIFARFMAMIQQAVAAAMPFIEQFAAGVGQFLVGALAALMPLLVAVGEFLMGVLQPILAIITPAIQGVAEAFSGIGTTASGITGVAEIFTQIVTAIVTAIPIIVNAITQVMLTLITTIVGFLPQIITAGITIITSLITGLLQALPQIIQALVTLITSLITQLVAMLPMLIQGALQLFQGIVQGLAMALPMILQAIVQLVVSLIGALVQAIPLILEAAIQLFTALVEALPVIIPLLLEGIVSMITGLLEALIAAIPIILEGAITLFMALLDALIEIIPMVITTTIELIPTVIAALISMIPILLNGAITLFMALVEALPRILPQLISAVVNLIPQIISTLIGLIPVLLDAAFQLFMAIVQAVPKIIPKVVSALIDLGTQMINGLMQGINNMAQAVIDSVGNVVNGAIDWAKGLLGIQSPSRVFAEMGMYTIMGLVKGIHSERRSLNQEMASVATSMIDFYDQVGAAAELDASLSMGSSVSLDSTSMQAQLAALSAQLQEIAAKDTINIENLEVNNPEPEPVSESLPNAVRKAAYLVG